MFVTENSLVQCISEIRAAFGKEGSDILKTVARRGYLLSAPVTAVDPAREELSSTAGRVPVLRSRQTANERNRG